MAKIDGVAGKTPGRTAKQSQGKIAHHQPQGGGTGDFRTGKLTPERLGPLLRGVRRKRNCSLAEVAQATNISASFLSLIENGKSDITFTRLVRLVDFYGITLAELLPDEWRNHPVVVRKGEELRVHSPSEGIDALLLSANTNDRLLSPTLVTFAPNGAIAEKVSHEGEEFVYVLEGEILLELDGLEPVLLKAGDSAHYSALRPHGQRNLTNKPVRLFSVTTAGLHVEVGR